MYSEISLGHQKLSTVPEQGIPVSLLVAFGKTETKKNLLIYLLTDSKFVYLAILGFRL